MVPHMVVVKWWWGAETFTAMSSTWAGKPPTAVARALSLPWHMLSPYGDLGAPELLLR